MWHGVPFACQRRPIVGVLRMCWLLPGSFDCFCCPHTSVHRPSIACLAVFLCGPGALFLHALCHPPPPPPRRAILRSPKRDGLLGSGLYRRVMMRIGLSLGCGVHAVSFFARLMGLFALGGLPAPGSL